MSNKVISQVIVGIVIVAAVILLATSNVFKGGGSSSFSSVKGSQALAEIMQATIAHDSMSYDGQGSISVSTDSALPFPGLPPQAPGVPYVVDFDFSGSAKDTDGAISEQGRFGIDATSFMPGMELDIEVRALPDQTIYLMAHKLPNLGLINLNEFANQWVRISIDDIVDQFGQFMSPDDVEELKANWGLGTGFDPELEVEVVALLADSNAIGIGGSCGSDTIDGHTVSCQKVQFDIEAFVIDFMPALAQFIADNHEALGIDAAAVESITEGINEGVKEFKNNRAVIKRFQKMVTVNKFELWVDDDNLPRRSVVEIEAVVDDKEIVEAPVNVSVNLDATYSYEKAVSVTAPAESTPLSEFMEKALGGFGFPAPGLVPGGDSMMIDNHDHSDGDHDHLSAGFGFDPSDFGGELSPEQLQQLQQLQELGIPELAQ